MGPVPGWEGRSSRFVDLNDRGAVLGIGLGPQSFERGYVWADGVITPVNDDFFGINQSLVADLNNRGQVIGRDDRGAFLWRDGVLIYLGTLPGRVEVDPMALNERGRVVGWSTVEADDSHRAFLWTRAGLTEIGPAGVPSEAVDLNDRGQVVGAVTRAAPDGSTTSSAFVWQDGVLVDLGARATGSSSAVAISERGHVIGTVVDDAGARRAVLWTVKDSRRS